MANREPRSGDLWKLVPKDYLSNVVSFQAHFLFCDTEKCQRTVSTVPPHKLSSDEAFTVLKPILDRTKLTNNITAVQVLRHKDNRVYFLRLSDFERMMRFVDSAENP